MVGKVEIGCCPRTRDSSGSSETPVLAASPHGMQCKASSRVVLNADLRLFVSDSCHTIFVNFADCVQHRKQVTRRRIDPFVDSSSSDNRVCSQHTLRQICHHPVARKCQSRSFGNGRESKRSEGLRLVRPDIPEPYGYGGVTADHRRTRKPRRQRKPHVLCSRSSNRSPERNCTLRIVRILYGGYITMDRVIPDGAPPRLDFTALPGAKTVGEDVGRAVNELVQRSKLTTARRAMVTPAPANPSTNMLLR